MKILKKRLLSIALALVVFHVASPAFALSPCNRSDCGLAPMTLLLGLPAATLGAVGGTFLVPAIANNITTHDIAYWKLSLVNAVVTTATGIAVSVGTLDLFKSSQEGGYIMACLFAPIVAGALTTWAIHAFFGGPPSVARAPPSALIPAVAMVVTPDEQNLMLAWQF